MFKDNSSIDRSDWDEVKIDGSFSALIPPEWEVENDGEVVVFDPDGFGELNIGVIAGVPRGGKKQRAFDVISGWAEELGFQDEGLITMFKRSRELLIASAEFTADEPEGELVYWRIFPVIGERIALDVSYSCPVEDRDREEAVIEAIIDSIKLIEPKVEPLTERQPS